MLKANLTRYLFLASLKKSFDNFVSLISSKWKNTSSQSVSFTKNPKFLESLKNFKIPVDFIPDKSVS